MTHGTRHNERSDGMQTKSDALSAARARNLQTRRVHILQGFEFAVWYEQVSHDQQLNGKEAAHREHEQLVCRCMRAP